MRIITRSALGARTGATILIVLASAFTVMAGTQSTESRPVATARPGAAEQAIRAVLDAQVAAWNRGDIEGFMKGYARSRNTRFASGGTVVRGWQTVHDRYKVHYDTREKMGQLVFSDLEITVLSARSAVAFGHWRLDRVGKMPSGLFTLLFTRSNAGWRIIADHTSSAEATPAPSSD